MGAWGFKTFENDDSSDWLYELEESSDLTVIESAISEANEDYIEAPEGCNILAAAEIILALHGKAKESLPDNAEQWVSKNKSLDTSGLRDKAIQAIDKLLSDSSELKELWQETDDFEFWVKDVTSIKSALSEINH
ncbi:DUF4259 domain-containing protein [Litoribrevibacter euphylliae]|uniref:DUF4259 domain-containing protein n=1 Tax=Litoribrevibacter euphylliae TaxID=1834034 RepID=A0ABV7HDT7_9GAMM